MKYSERKYRRPYKSNKRFPLLVYLIIALTIIVSFWPGFHPETYFISGYHWQLDIFCHAGFYFTGALLLYSVIKRRHMLTTFLFPGLLVLSWGLEGIQHFIPGRAFSLLDMTSNSLGILLAVGTIKLRRKY